VVRFEGDAFLVTDFFDLDEEVFFLDLEAAGLLLRLLVFGASLLGLRLRLRVVFRLREEGAGLRLRLRRLGLRLLLRVGLRLLLRGVRLRPRVGVRLVLVLEVRLRDEVDTEREREREGDFVDFVDLALGAFLVEVDEEERFFRVVEEDFEEEEDLVGADNLK